MSRANPSGIALRRRGVFLFNNAEMVHVMSAHPLPSTLVAELDEASVLLPPPSQAAATPLSPWLQDWCAWEELVETLFHTAESNAADDDASTGSESVAKQTGAASTSFPPTRARALLENLINFYEPYAQEYHAAQEQAVILRWRHMQARKVEGELLSRKRRRASVMCGGKAIQTGQEGEDDAEACDAARETSGSRRYADRCTWSVSTPLAPFIESLLELYKA